MPRPIRKDHNMELYQSILRLESVEDCFQFFSDLCSATELSALEQRFSVAQLLLGGRVYTDILSETGASSATISRVNRVLQNGTGVMAKIMEESE